MEKYPYEFHWQRGFLALAMVVRFERSRLNAIAKAKKLFVCETCLRFHAIDMQISFLALAIASKKYPKLSVKLAQSSCNLEQSVKLGGLASEYLSFGSK